VKLNFIFLILVFIALLVSSNLFAQNVETCPAKTIDNGTETGEFLWSECCDFCHIGIKRDIDDLEKHFLVDGDAQDFDAKPGTRVSYNYDYVQFLNEFAGECSKDFVIISI
jgi:hypothetical protein